MTDRSAGRRLLLAHSYYLRYDEKQWQRMKPYPPLATLIVAALMRDRGYDVRLFDAMLSPGVEAFEAELDDFRPGIVGIVEDNFNYLTKMCTLRMRYAALRMVRAAAERGCRVAVNGSDATDHPESFLEAGADAVILGDVEPTFLELADVWSAGRDRQVRDIQGLVLRGPQPGTVRRTPARPWQEDLDGLPLPAWDLVDVEEYRQAWVGAHGRLSWNMVASRGCPYGCNWCAKPLFGRRYSQRSPEGVAYELRKLRDDVAPDHVWFADDIFGLTTSWISDFAAEVTRLGARTPFTIQSRVNLMTPRAVEALAVAGAEEVWLGVESGSQKILDAMDKGSRVEQIRAATRTLREHGVRPCWFIQLGYLGEDWEDVLRTRDLIREERPHDIGVSVSYPLPGTRFHEMVREHLGEKRNWEHTGDLDMMFYGTFVTDFYRRIRDLLHQEVDALRAGAAPTDFDHRWDELAAQREEYRNVAAHA